MRGLYNNLKNTYVVYMILFDYFNIKGNVLYSTSNLLESIGLLVTTVNKRVLGNSRKGVKRTSTFLSKSKVIFNLQPFHTFMRYRMGMATYDELRLFLRELIPDVLPIPGDMESLQTLMTEKISEALIGAAQNISMKFRGYTDVLFREDDSSLKPEELIDHPLIISVVNQIRSLKGIVKEIATKEISLEEAIKRLTLYDPETILKESAGRQAKEFVVMGAVTKKFIKACLRVEDDALKRRDRDRASKAMVGDFSKQRMTLDSVRTANLYYPLLMTHGSLQRYE
jgi:hypothetical protein